MLESPFPALTYLSLGVHVTLKTLRDDIVLRDEFLGGSAPPSLRTLILWNIQFPALPKLLLSTTQLVTLRLSSDPILDYISLREIVTCLAALPNLKHLVITRHMFPDPDQSPLPTRVVLPFLTSFSFGGLRDHLEDLVTHIDAPMLRPSH